MPQLVQLHCCCLHLPLQAGCCRARLLQSTYAAARALQHAPRSYCGARAASAQSCTCLHPEGCVAARPHLRPRVPIPGKPSEQVDSLSSLHTQTVLCCAVGAPAALEIACLLCFDDACISTELPACCSSRRVARRGKLMLSSHQRQSHQVEEFCCCACTTVQKPHLVSGLANCHMRWARGC